MKVWGVDPGLNGALACFDHLVGTLTIHDMPTMEVNKKRHVNAQLVESILSLDHAAVFIERVGAMPGQGVSSMFSFGRSYGVVIGVAAGLQMPTTLVSPQVWQKAVRCQKGKDASRQRACEVFPAFAKLFARKKDDGRSDAALLAYYATFVG